jgi:hypothetical protein
MDNAGFDSTVDRLKFVAAALDQVQGDLGSHVVSDAHAIEAALCRLDCVQHVLRDLVELLCPHCVRNMDHYNDYRPVASCLPLGDGTQYVHCWHPDPAHPGNGPHDVGTVTTRHGHHKRIVVSAPGYLDSITLSEIPEPSREIGSDGECHL